MKDVKILRRVTFLASNMGAPYKSYGVETYDYLKDLEHWLSYGKDCISYGKDRVELLTHFKTLGWTNEEVLDFWRKASYERRMKRSVYNQKPIPVKKDNRNMYGEKFMGCGTRRRPRKVRKTAWKRFYKLFPNEKPK